MGLFCHFWTICTIGQDRQNLWKFCILPKIGHFCNFFYTYFLHKILRLFCASLLFATFMNHKPPKTIHFPLFYEHYSKIFLYLSICFSVRTAYTLYIYKIAAAYLTIFQHDKKFDSLKKIFPTRPGVSRPVDLGGVWNCPIFQKKFDEGPILPIYFDEGPIFWLEFDKGQYWPVRLIPALLISANKNNKGNAKNEIDGIDRKHKSRDISNNSGNQHWNEN